MQRFLEAHPCFLVQHLAEGSGAWVMPQARLGAEHVTDFLIAEMGYSGLMWYAVELERPHARIFTKKSDPSAALTHAIRQIEDWRAWLLRNLDYATRPRHQSGLGLTDIQPHLEGLIIMGCAQDLDPIATAAQRQSLERAHQIKIRTYDWLADKARDHLAAREHAQDSVSASQGNFLSELPGAIFSAPRQEDSVRRTIDRVFGGIFSAWANPGAAREIEYEGVSFPFGCDTDNNVEVPLCIVRAGPGGKLLEPHDWKDWTGYVGRDIRASYSLLVTEMMPSQSLQDALTMEDEGVWCDPQTFSAGKVGAQEQRLSGLDMLVYLPPASSGTERQGRLIAAREVFHRYITLERDRQAGWEAEAELKAGSLALAPGDKVIHDVFGFGAVVSVSGFGADVQAIIDFGAPVGVKHLVLGYAPLKKL